MDNGTAVHSSYHWRKAGKTAGPREFLRARESYYVAASTRFLHGNEVQVWSLGNKEGNLGALLLSHNRIFFPVFSGQADIPLPLFMKRVLRKIPIHLLQGLRSDAEALEAAIAPWGYEPAQRIEYDLMALDREPNPALLTTGPAGLMLRQPRSADMDGLFRLQAAYEQEEVLPWKAEFNPAVCRMSLEQLVAHESMLVAELDSRLVGKINTTGASFSRYQIGGVYVDPPYRGLGIASRMSAVFLQGLLSEGKGITLFVKKQNPAACRMYRHIGFAVLGDYRLSYF